MLTDEQERFINSDCLTFDIFVKSLVIYIRQGFFTNLSAFGPKEANAIRRKIENLTYHRSLAIRVGLSSEFGNYPNRFGTKVLTAVKEIIDCFTKIEHQPTKLKVFFQYLRFGFFDRHSTLSSELRNVDRENAQIVSDICESWLKGLPKEFNRISCEDLDEKINPIFTFSVEDISMNCNTTVSECIIGYPSRGIPYSAFKKLESPGGTVEISRDSLRDYGEDIRASLGTFVGHCLVLPELSLAENDALRLIVESSNLLPNIFICGIVREGPLKSSQCLVWFKGEIKPTYVSKSYPSKFEEPILESDWKLYFFDSTEIGNFAVILCSDFLRYEAVLTLKGSCEDKMRNLDILFIVSANPDPLSYLRLALGDSLRLGCFIVVVNNYDLDDRTNAEKLQERLVPCGRSYGSHLFFPVGGEVGSIHETLLKTPWLEDGDIHFKSLKIPLGSLNQERAKTKSKDNFQRTFKFFQEPF